MNDAPSFSTPREVAEWLATEQNDLLTIENADTRVLLLTLSSFGGMLANVDTQVTDSKSVLDSCQAQRDSATDDLGFVLVCPESMRAEFGTLNDVAGNFLDILAIDLSASRWRSLMCDDIECCPVEGQPIHKSPVAWNPEQGRADLAKAVNAILADISDND
jgi:carbamoylphosphate synthase small subunit